MTERPAPDTSEHTAPKTAMAGRPVLEVRDLTMHFPVKGSRNSVVHALDGVSFDLNPGETLGVVGESGCGKSTMARCILRIYEPTSGSIYLNGVDITRLKQKELRKHRSRMQMIFQDPHASLDARMVVRDIIAEPLIAMGLRKSGKDAEDSVIDMLERVGLSREHAGRYPHEFSGGQLQRIGAARALILHPQAVVCDEPVSALDVSIRAQLINMLKELQNGLGLSYIFISHDLSMVRYMADRVAVMYLGQIVELCDGDAIYEAPLHPYTAGLLQAVPIADPRVARQKTQEAIGGDIASPVNPPHGCRFHTRCPYRSQICSQQRPPLRDYGGGRLAACHFPLTPKL